MIKGRFQHMGNQRGVSTIGLHEIKAELAFISNHVRRDKHVHANLAISTLTSRYAKTKYRTRIEKPLNIDHPQ